MANSANGPCEDQAREIVPSELLFVHEGLEEDGESWRATLPLADNLLRRVVIFPTPMPTPATASPASDIHLDVSASAPPAPQKHHRHRPIRH
ncbi:MAG TPA: hypothetical protein VFW76_05630 [Ktedonobacterales bacterium]|nr:hypothetical protein [Ktedonobacterales bacterium]